MSEPARELRLPFGDSGSLPGLWQPAAPGAAVAFDGSTVVVAHGAGAGMRHPFLAGVAEGLTGQGHAVLRFEFPYMAEGRRSPDRVAVLMGAWRAALAEAGRRAGERHIVASGKSLGGRMASMLAAEEGDGFAASALIFFGYPLHAPGREDRVRDAHLFDIGRPMLFIEGTRDPFATFGLLEDVVARLGSLARMHVIEGADHSFRVKGAHRPDGEIGRELGVVAASFIGRAAS